MKTVPGSPRAGLVLPLALLLVMAGCEHSGGDYDASPPSGMAATRAPDLLVVLVDDWALSDLAAARDDANPWNDLINVDALAAQGLTWNNFYTQAICNPTRASLMLGRYVGDSTGGVCNAPGPDTPKASAPTVAKLLRDEGYATAAFGKWHIGTNPDAKGRWEDAPGVYGFDAWRAWNASNLGGHCSSKSYSDWYRVDDGVAFQSQEYHTEAVSLAVCDWWQQTDGPKLAYVNFQAPHQPLHTPPSWLLPAGYPTPTSAREEYEAMLVAMDTALGQILSMIDPSATYVVLMGDNGTPPAAIRSDQTSRRVKKSTFEDGVNVPFVVTGPEVRFGETEALGHAVDLMATLVELAGGTLDPLMTTDSVSLVPVLDDPAARPRDHVIADHVDVGPTGLSVRDTSVVLATPNGLLKGRFFRDDARNVNSRTFYDLAADPGETSGVAEGGAKYKTHVAAIKKLKNAYYNR
jgi:arylsulfatase A-like enzyme